MSTEMYALFSLFVVQLLSGKKINRLLRFFLRSKLFSTVTPQRFLNKIPVTGIVRASLPRCKEIYLESNGFDNIAKQLYWGGIENYKEYDTVNLFTQLLKISNTFFDIGANTGLYALIAALENPDRQVYAFEPVPKIIKFLERNKQLNHVTNLQVEPKALTNFDGEITLYVPNLFAASIPTSATTRPGFRPRTEAITVPAIKLDSFITQNKISKVDLLKIDTETTEDLVLEGAQQILLTHRPIIICEVLPEQAAEKLHNILDKWSYRYFKISNNGLVEKYPIEGDGRYMNYLFISEKKLPDVMDIINTRIAFLGKEQ